MTECEPTETHERSKLIGIVDDDEAMQDSLRDLMEAAGLVARRFNSAGEFFESDLHRQAACVIADVLMPKMRGPQLQARLKEKGCNVSTIFVTAHGDARTRIQAIEMAQSNSYETVRSSIVAQNGPNCTQYVSNRFTAIVSRASKGGILWPIMQRSQTVEGIRRSHSKCPPAYPRENYARHKRHSVSLEKPGPQQYHRLVGNEEGI